MLPILIRKITMTVKAAEVSNSWLFQLTGAVKLCHAQKITGFRFIGVFVTEVIK